MNEQENNGAGLQSGIDQGGLPSESVVVGETSGATDVTLNTPEEQQSAAPEQAPRTTVAGVVVQQSEAAPATDRDIAEVQEAFAHGEGSMVIGLNQLLEYCSLMAPAKRQTPESSAQNQLQLANALSLILSADDENFRLGIRATLSLFAAHATNCFAPNLRNRGLMAADINIIDNKLMRFLTRIVDALVICAGSKDRRDALKHIDIQKVLSAVPNVRARQNLTAFFS